MGTLQPDQVTLYLKQIEDGDRRAVDELLPYIYDDLHGLAQGIFRDQWRDHTLQPTALVHEAYMRLVQNPDSCTDGRKQFFKVAAIAMRQLLTDYARKRSAEKRGGRMERVKLESGLAAGGDDNGIDLIALDDALSKLQTLDERQAQVVQLRFLAGLTIEEAAEVLGIAPRTVRLDWQMARNWLRRELEEEPASDS
jgi:RNA polymerase sigma-70 factor (ECF subfamily)